MLIRFAIENHLSIKEKQEISLVASSLQDKGADLISASKINLIPAAIIYGANASGKSNFVLGFEFLRDTVLNSHQRGGPETKIPRNPFLLDEKSRSLPTTVDLDFFLRGVRFHYGFSAADKSFTEEWLFAFPSGKKQTWFHRLARKKQIYFGKQMKGPLRTIESLMRPNSLFLSVAAQNAHVQLTPLFEYIRNFTLKYVVENRTGDALMAFAEGKVDDRIIHFLDQADSGIITYRFEDVLEKFKKRGFDQNELARDFLELVKKYTKSRIDLKDLNLEDIRPKKMSLGHRVASGIPQFFELSLESAGTLRLLILLKSIFEALDRGSLVVIDELDASLHTYLAENLVKLFNSRVTNPRGAQLVATTHDTNLLRKDLIRRDQIWFAEKDHNGATNIYPLTDIRTRNSDNLEKGYLEGRFGAVPFRGPVDLLAPSDQT
jgi:AAA15 family ATPase/GTPase